MTAIKTSIESKDRLKEIISILVKYGIADWLSQSKSEWIKKLVNSDKHKYSQDLSTEERIRLAFLELGTTFIKLGQILSTRADLVGEPIANELAKLQSSTPADNIEQVSKRIKDEFGINSVDELFDDFSAEAIASASIAQVHTAKLKTGESVVVKVMHDDIERTIIADLDIMTTLASLAQKHGGPLKAFQPAAFIRQFKQSMLDELDFNKELKNIIRFTDNFEEDDRVVFPKAFTQCSGKTVLTMSFLDGVPLPEVAELEWTPEEKTDFTEESADVFMEMMFRDRFYHADPHPGNLFVREDGSLGIIDCGMVAKVDAKTNDILEELIIGVAQKDTEHIRNTILDMCSIPKDIDYDELSSQIEEFINKYIDLPLNEFDMSASIEECTSIIHQYHLILPASMSNLLRVVMLLEGSSRLLNPDFNIVVLFKNYHYKIIKRRYAPQALLKRAMKNINHWERIVDLVPKALEKFFRKAGSDNFEVNLEHRNLEESVNRIVLGLLSASLFLGSSLLWALKVPPIVNGYSLPGIAGIISAIYLGVSLIKSIKRSNK
ncbi:ABC1 kinase family protein [Saccharicrinis aurantiacus]|uniref:ABC1 kinase family protein n=1 Tax=Saccharicrinis aurantiacus TaxID=1849719 RepID=UPI00094F8107|nr:AarF/UbiB family protein [Saccharicrinis aurantiacus]